MQKTITSTKYLRLVKWLAQARNTRGLTTRELGDKLSRPNSFVTKVEQAERRLDVCEFVAYCDALDIDPHDGINIVHSKK